MSFEEVLKNREAEVWNALNATEMKVGGGPIVGYSEGGVKKWIKIKWKMKPKNLNRLKVKDTTLFKWQATDN